MLHNDNQDQSAKVRAEELFKLGDHYRLQKQYTEANLHYEEAIALGNTSAVNNRAFMHQKGYGEKDGKPNDAKAIELYERAIALGNADAMCNRAFMHYNGHGEKDGKPNYTNALSLFLNYLSKSNDLEWIAKTEKSISIIIEKHLGALAANLIFQLLNTEQLTNVLSDRIGYFKHRKLDLVAYFRTLPEPEQFEAVKKALDQSHPLGKLFALPEGTINIFRSIFGATPDPLKEGTLINEVYKLFTQLDEKRKLAASSSSTNTISESLSGTASPAILTIRPQPPIASYQLPHASALLEPVFIKKKDLNDAGLVSALFESLQTTPSASYSFILTNEINTLPYAAAPLSPQRIAFQPFFFTNEMSALPSVAALPRLPVTDAAQEESYRYRINS